MSLQSLLSKIHKTLIEKNGGLGKKRANFLQQQEIWHRRSLGIGLLRCFRPPLSPCNSGVKQFLSMELNWVSFEVDLFLIREILPFMCLSPGYQALCTWKSVQPWVLSPSPLEVWTYFQKFDSTSLIVSLQPFVLPSPPHPLSLTDQASCPQEGISGLPQSLERISLFYKYSVSLLKVDR